MTGTDKWPASSCPDGGWGWVVALGAAVVQMQAATIATTYGVYFAHLTSSPESGTQELPAALVSAVPSVMSAVMFFLCPVSTALSKHYGARPVAVTGSLLFTSSVALAAAVDSFSWFALFFAVFGGVGAGLVLVQGNITTQQYFDRRRGIANGIFMSGGALGNMTMPILLRYSLNWWGLQGTLLVHAACISPTILAALAFTPPPAITRQGVKNSGMAREEEEGEKKEEKEKSAELGEKDFGAVKMGSGGRETNKSKGVEEEIGGTAGPKAGEGGKGGIIREGGEGGVRVFGIWLPKLGDIFVWSVLKNPLFLLFTFSIVSGRTAHRAFGMLVPAFGETIGLGREGSTYLLTVMSVADFLSRSLTPLVTDLLLKGVRKQRLFFIFPLLMALSMAIFATLVTDFLTAAAASALFGVAIGGLATFMNVIFAEGLGIDKIKDTIGLMYLLTGFWTLPILPLLGLLRDLTGDFQQSFLVLCGTLLAGSAVWLLEPGARRYGKSW